jgi:hypothetical protein
VAVVSPARPKASIQESSRGLEVIIPARRNWFLTLFLGFWLCGWAVGEVMAAATFLAPDADAGPQLFLIVWLVGWTLGGGFAIFVFLWSLMGHERVQLTSSMLSLKHELFGIGRLREYELHHVRDLRVAPSPYNPYDFRSGMRFWGIGGGTIAFDHGAATVRFGAALEEGEAKKIVERLGAFASGITAPGERS